MKDVTRFLPYNSNLVERAKKLRKNMTYVEKKIWNEYLKKLSFKVLRQRPIDNFIVYFYCPSLNLVVEIDGDSHFTESDHEERTKIPKRHDFNVIRFTNDEVINYFEAVGRKIDNFLVSPLLRGVRGYLTTK